MSTLQVDWSVDHESEQTKFLGDIALRTRHDLHDDSRKNHLMMVARGQAKKQPNTPPPPQFHSTEVDTTTEPVLWFPHAADYSLRSIQLSVDSTFGDSGEEEIRGWFADRTMEGQFYAVRSSQPPHTEASVREWVTEVFWLTQVAPKHPNIIQAYGQHEEDDVSYETDASSLLRSGTLGAFLITDSVAELLTQRIQSWRRSGLQASTKPPPVNQRLETAMDLASALLHLHSRGIVYYLTPSKAGFDSRYGRIKLCHFGQARYEQPPSSTMTETMLAGHDVHQTLLYTAPEVHNGVIAPASDVYAFGILVWEMVTLRVPYEEISGMRTQLYHAVATKKQRPLLEPTEWSSSVVKELVQSCWAPRIRPSMKSVHDALEMALLFPDEEAEEVKQDYMQSRQGSYSSMDGLLASPRVKEKEETKSGHSGSNTSRTTMEEEESHGGENDDTEVMANGRGPLVRTQSELGGEGRVAKPVPKRSASVDSLYKTPARRKKKVQGKHASPDGKVLSPTVSPAVASSQTSPFSQPASAKITERGESRRRSTKGGSNHKLPEDTDSSHSQGVPKSPRRRPPSNKRKDDQNKTPRRLAHSTSPNGRRASSRRRGEGSPYKQELAVDHDEDFDLRTPRKPKERRGTSKTPRRRDSPHVNAKPRKSDPDNSTTDVFQVFPRSEQFNGVNATNYTRRSLTDMRSKSLRRQPQKEIRTPSTNRGRKSFRGSPSPQDRSKSRGKRVTRSRSFTHKLQRDSNSQASGSLAEQSNQQASTGSADRTLSEGAVNKSKVMSDQSLNRAVGNLRIKE